MMQQFAPRFEWKLLAGRHAFLGHGEQHCDGDVGPGDRGEVDHLLLAEQFLRAGEGLVGRFASFIVSSVTKSYTAASSGAMFDVGLFALSSAMICGDSPAFPASGP